MTVDAYPLTWPSDWERTKVRRKGSTALTFGIVRDRLLRELTLMHVTDVVLSSNIPLRPDGLPYSKFREPEDPGVAVYFERKGKSLVIARDAFTQAMVNLWSLGQAIKHLRGMERHGGALLERSFHGFLALPAPNGHAPWWQVLRILRATSLPEIEARYRELAKLHHSDKGGSDEQMVELNRAITEARQERAT